MDCRPLLFWLTSRYACPQATRWVSRHCLTVEDVYDKLCVAHWAWWFVGAAYGRFDEHLFTGFYGFILEKSGYLWDIHECENLYALRWFGHWYMRRSAVQPAIRTPGPPILSIVVSNLIAARLPGVSATEVNRALVAHAKERVSRDQFLTWASGLV